MKIIKRFLVLLLLIGGIFLISCGGGGGEDGDPEPYIRFSGSGYGDNEWIVGLSDYAGGVPAGACKANGYGQPTNFNGIGLSTSIDITNFNRQTKDHIYIATSSVNERLYVAGDSNIFMRINGKQGSVQFELDSSRTVKFTKVTDKYVEGVFQGKTPGGENVLIEGSFVFKRTPDGTWPLSWPQP